MCCPPESRNNTTSDAKLCSGQGQCPRVGENATPQQQVSLSPQHLFCFDDAGLVALEKNRCNATVIDETIENNPVLFQENVKKCLSLDAQEVHFGVEQLLVMVEVVLRLANLPIVPLVKAADSIAKIAAKMLRLNQNTASPFHSLVHSWLFAAWKKSNRCVVFAGTYASMGFNRLLWYFQIKPPQTNSGNLLDLIVGKEDDWPLVILDSESGNGKTMAWSWLADDLNTGNTNPDHLRCVLLVVLHQDLMAQPGESHEIRRKYLEEELGALLERQLKQLSTDKEREGFRKATWFIALDEVSSIPNLLRTLCVHRMDIARYLEGKFGFAAGSVRILAAGTGSGGIVTPVSCPKDCKVVTLLGQTKVPPPKGCTQDGFRSHIRYNHLDKFDIPVTRAMWNAMMHIPYIEQAVGNPRFAECLMERCHILTEQLSGVDSALITRAMIDTVVELSCVRFKELNACSRLDREQMTRVVAQAVKYAIVPERAAELPHGFATYGMGRDLAVAMPLIS